MVIANLYSGNITLFKSSSRLIVVTGVSEVCT